MPHDGLIGSTGFVGTTLATQHRFAAGFDSATIGTAAGQRFDLVVCAAAPGSMFEANRLPNRDGERIDRLIDGLGGIRAARFVLISTIAVLEGFAAADEADAVYETSLAYGVNRRRLELFVADRFPSSLILRLPALFGAGLRKNFLYDILNPVPAMLTAERLDIFRDAIAAGLRPTVDRAYRWREELGLYAVDRDLLEASGARPALDAACTAAGLSAVAFTNPQSRFQFYDMTGLWADVGRGLDAGLDVLHIAPAPLTAAAIYAALRGAAMPESAARRHTEDMRTAHAALWGRDGPYIADGDEIVGAMRALFAGEPVS